MVDCRLWQYFYAASAALTGTAAKSGSPASSTAPRHFLASRLFSAPDVRIHAAGPPISRQASPGLAFAGQSCAGGRGPWYLVLFELGLIHQHRPVDGLF